MYGAGEVKEPGPTVGVAVVAVDVERAVPPPFPGRTLGDKRPVESGAIFGRFSRRFIFQTTSVSTYENGNITDYRKASSATITIKFRAPAQQDCHTVDATVICCGLTSFLHCHIFLEFVRLHYFFRSHSYLSGERCSSESLPLGLRH